MTKKEVRNDDSHTLMVLERKRKKKNFQKYLELKRSIHSTCKMKTRNKSLIKKQECVDKILFDSDNIIFYGISENIQLLDDI